MAIVQPAPHILITGSGRRLGRAIAQSLVERGARVSAHVHKSNAPPGCVELRADLRDLKALEALVQQARSQQGPIHWLINSAADFFPTPTGQCSAQQWERLHSLNLRAPYFLAQACYPDLKAAQGGLINICDIHTHTPLRNFAPYAATKGGLWTLTRTLATEWAPEVRVNSISPGAVLVPDDFDDEQSKRQADMCALGRLGTPEDIVHAILFLMNNAFITGFDLRVDGGP